MFKDSSSCAYPITSVVSRALENLSVIICTAFVKIDLLLISLRMPATHYYSEAI